MNDGMTQAVRIPGSQASQSLGAVFEEAFGPLLHFAGTITRNVRTFLAGQASRHLAWVPVPVPGPNPDRPPGGGRVPFVRRSR